MTPKQTPMKSFVLFEIHMHGPVYTKRQFHIWHISFYAHNGVATPQDDQQRSLHRLVILVEFFPVCVSFACKWLLQYNVYFCH